MVNMDELSSKLLEELIKTKNALDDSKKRVSELEGSLPFRGELVSEELPFEEKGTEIRVRIQSPSKFNSDSFRRKPFPPSNPKPGVAVIYACPQGKWNGKTCQVGMQIQALRFAKDKGWTPTKVKSYLKGHSFKSEGSLEEMRSSEALERSILESKPLTVKGVALKAGRWNRYFYPKDELEKAASTLNGKPIVVDHGKGVRDIVGQVIRGWWDKDVELVKFEGEILSDDIKVLIKRGLVHFTSPGSDFTPISTANGLTATNITFYELALTTHPAYVNGIHKTLSRPSNEYPYIRPETKGNGEQMGKDNKNEELEAKAKPVPGATGTNDSSSNDATSTAVGTVINPGETGTGTGTETVTGTGAVIVPPQAPTVTGVDIVALKEKVTGLESKVGSLTKELEVANATKKAEEDAKLKTEADAKVAAEAEAKVKEEAANKVAVETKAREEAEAKAKVDAEANIKAETEAKARAEAEAKAKSEAETKAAAEAKVKEEVVKPPIETVDISKLSSAELLILRDKRRGHTVES